jgi:hypothetical protein
MEVVAEVSTLIFVYERTRRIFAVGVRAWVTPLGFLDGSGGKVSDVFDETGSNIERTDEEAVLEPRDVSP